jgi:hypothetical protein
MGLDTTHGCWHGAYSSFNQWRRAICKAAGYGDLMERDGFGSPYTPWPDGDVLVALLNHSDCDGDLPWEICGELADRLESLVPAMRLADLDGYLGHKTTAFIEGLRVAYSLRENVEFH